MAQQSFSVGDTVRLKSGGPLMTIEKIGNDESNAPRVWCVWFDDKNKQQRGGFRPEALQPDDGAPVIA